MVVVVVVIVVIVVLVTVVCLCGALDRHSEDIVQSNFKSKIR